MLTPLRFVQDDMIGSVHKIHSVQDDAGFRPPRILVGLSPLADLVFANGAEFSMADACAFLTGLGVCLPNDPVRNDQIDTVLGSLGRSSERIKRRILMNNGIRQRYYAIDPATGAQTHTNARLAAESILALCRDTRFSVRDLSCLACGTSSPDQLIPSHASMVQAELGFGPCELASLSGVCCSGMAAFKYGYLHVLHGQDAQAIVSGSELASTSLTATYFGSQLSVLREQHEGCSVEKEPSIAFRNEFLRWMLSDGAGAALIRAAPRETGWNLRIDWIDILSYAHQSPPCMYAGMVKSEDGSIRHYRSMHDPQEFFQSGVLNLSQDVDILQDRLPRLMSSAIAAVQHKRGLHADSIDWLLPHYSSNWFREPLFRGMSELGLEVPYERWFTNLETKGNTGAASMFIILEELMASDRVKPGQRLLCIVPESARMSFCFLHLTAI